jgi:hypothetical protein
MNRGPGYLDFFGTVLILRAVFHLVIWWDTHLYRFSKHSDYINKQNISFSVVVALSFSTYDFVLIINITIVKK